MMQARNVSSFLSTLGVNTHTGYLDSVYGVPSEAATSRLLQKLSYLGIDKIRDSMAADWQLPQYRALAAANIKYDFLISVVPTADSVEKQLANIATVGGNVVGIEGPNETDLTPLSYAGLTGLSATALLQARLYELVHGNPALASVPVIQASFGREASFDTLNGLGSADWANSHSYFYDFSKPIAQQIQSRIDDAHRLLPNAPVVTTETGWVTTLGPSSYPLIDYTTQSKFVLDVVFDQFNAGIRQTYLYQLSDQPALDDYYGLFESDGHAKPAAVALHNLTTILNDGGGTSSASGSSLDYSINGATSTTQSTLLQKKNGHFVLALWNEAPLLDSITGANVVVAPVPVIVSLPYAATIDIYDPLTGTSVVRHVDQVTEFRVEALDHPILIEIARFETPSPNSSASVPALDNGLVQNGSASLFGNGVATFVPAPSETDPDTLVFQVSEDAYGADAAFVFKVDGVQVGGVYTTSAVHGSDAPQAITLHGGFASAEHLSVEFINDAYGGAGLDRNLYVDSVSLNGETLTPASVTGNGLVQNGSASLFANGIATFVPAPSETGPDTLVFQVSQDAYGADAAFVFKVDGVQVGGVYTTSAVHGSDAPQAITLHGGFASAEHLSVEFINDAYGGAGLDRNLYVDSVSLNGEALTPASVTGNGLVQNGSASLFANGIATFVPAPSETGPDTLVFQVSEDAYGADAAFVFKVDGVQVGGVYTTSAVHGSDAPQAITLHGGFASAEHLSVEFINDAYGGAGLDRNLYVDDVSLNGEALTPASVTGNGLVQNGSASLFANGVAMFEPQAPAPHVAAEWHLA